MTWNRQNETQQCEVKSNRLRVRRVKSEDNLADIGTKALSNKIIRKHETSMGWH